MCSCQALALGFAIISTRSTELPWQVRALRALPVFALPAVVTLLYSTCASYHRMSKNPALQLFCKHVCLFFDFLIFRI